MNKRFVIFDFDRVIVDSFSLALKINRKTIPNLTAEELQDTLKAISISPYQNITIRLIAKRSILKNTAYT